MMTVELHKFQLKTTAAWPNCVKTSTMSCYLSKHYYARKTDIITIPDQIQMLHAGIGAHNENLTQW